MLLASIAGISLFVGGVSIMNVMLVSVSEGTREIGLRLSVGARGRDVLPQFLVESVALCLLGGIGGIILGFLSTDAIARSAGWPALFSTEAVMVAVSVSAAVGCSSASTRLTKRRGSIPSSRSGGNERNGRVAVPDRSTIYHGQPSRRAPATEDLLDGAVHDLLRMR